MPTRPRLLAPGELYHVYSRSAGGKTIFHTDADYTRFLQKMGEYQLKFPTDVLAFCIMPNHFHLLIRPVEEATVSQSVQPYGLPQPYGLKTLGGNSLAASSTQHFLHRLITAYGKYYDFHHADHAGRVFQGTYKAKHVTDDSYALTLMAYIHDNPVRARLADQPQDWPWSSYHALSTPRVTPTLRVGPALTPPPSDLSHAQIYRAFAAQRTEQAEEVRSWLWA